MASWRKRSSGFAFTPSVAAAGVEVQRHAGIVLQEGLGVHVGELEHAHVRVGLLHPGTPEADVLDSGDDAGEKARAELAHLVRLEGELDALLDGEAERFPD